MAESSADRTATSDPAALVAEEVRGLLEEGREQGYLTNGHIAEALRDAERSGHPVKEGACRTHSTGLQDSGQTGDEPGAGAAARRTRASQNLIRRESGEVMRPMAQAVADTDAVAAQCEDDKSSLIQILLEIQRQNRWLSEEDLKRVSRELDVPLAQIYHVATFYKAFSLVPKGQHSISVCVGTACHVRGAARLLDRVVDTFKTRPGGTSADMRFSVDTVNCLGCCALGPVMLVDGQYFSKPSKEELEQLAAAG